ncbi:MAG: ABC transporter permease [Bacteroidales bacterium]|nr:ABC transporter permease [Bacteroidales bacterium]MBN2758228.1 ABC transporter permease [Bacteroidales bacterium]
MNYLKIAWRNLFRNKRRSLITISSVFFGVFFAVTMRSAQIGSLGNMIDNVVKSYAGYIQIQDSAYWENKSINNSFEINSDLDSILNNSKSINYHSPRLESFALAATEKNSKGVMLVGIDLNKEEKIIQVSKWLKKGKYLSELRNEILIGSDIAKYLKLELGDTITLIGSGYHGVSAAGLFVISGIIKFPSPELNGRIAFANISDIQDFYSAPNRFTSIVLMVDDYSKVEKAYKKISEKLEKNYRIMSWIEMQPELVQFVDSKTSSSFVFIFLLFLIIGFGILGTVIMMVAERKRELGVMIALGMKKTKLCIILFIEIFLMGFIGVFSSSVLTYPVFWYFEKNPIPIGGEAGKTMMDMGFEPLYVFSTKSEVFTMPATIVFFMVIFISFYAIWYISKIKVIRALRT